MTREHPQRRSGRRETLRFRLRAARANALVSLWVGYMRIAVVFIDLEMRWRDRRGLDRGGQKADSPAK